MPLKDKVVRSSRGRDNEKKAGDQLQMATSATREGSVMTTSGQRGRAGENEARGN